MLVHIVRWAAVPPGRARAVEDPLRYAPPHGRGGGGGTGLGSSAKSGAG